MGRKPIEYASCAFMLTAKVSRRISSIAFTLAAVVLLVLLSSPTPAQSTQPTPQPQSQSEPEPQSQPPSEPANPGADDDPTRAVFFSIREEYRNLRNGAWNNRIVFRRDKVVLRGKKFSGRTGFILRTDVPITTTHLGSETHTGLGDIYGQALYIPYLSRKFAFVTGTAIVLPTATHKTLGFGKWQVAPLAVPVWFFPKKKGFVSIKFQNFISVAGVSDRPGIHALFIQPTLNYIPKRRWLLQADAETRTNWKNQNRTDYRVGFGVGRVMHRKLFMGIKGEVPMGGTRPGDWTIKLVNIFYSL